MEIIYYRSGSGSCPARDYMGLRYGIRSGDKQRVRDSKAKQLAKIRAVIQMAADKNGRPGGIFSSSLDGYNFHELKSSEGNKNEKLRVLYFSYHGSQLVLLNAFDKPDLYEKGKKKKIDKKIELILKLTKTYYDDFLKNPDHHEKYE